MLTIEDKRIRNRARWNNRMKDPIKRAQVTKQTNENEKRRRQSIQYLTKVLSKEKEIHRQLKIKAVMHYGNKCVCCGETDLTLLNIDHINGGGTSHRKIVGQGHGFHRWLKRQQYPQGEFQILCYNCNMGKHLNNGKFCPHKGIIVTFPEQSQRGDRKYRWNLKIQIFDHYGWKCNCCDENNSLLLTIDHIDNDGAEQRKTIRSGCVFYRWIIKNKFPSNLQILCWNCNEGKRFNRGICPHRSLNSNRFDFPLV